MSDVLALNSRRITLPGDDLGDIDPKVESVLRDSGYFAWRLAGGRVYCLARFLFTWAIICDVDPVGYAHRYCFDGLPDALGAYLDWNCRDGEPVGHLVKKG